MVGPLETGQRELLGKVCHGPFVPCVFLSPLSLPFSSAKRICLIITLNINGIQNFVDISWFTSAASHQDKQDQPKHHAARFKLLPIFELTHLQLLFTCLYSMWQ